MPSTSAIKNPNGAFGLSADVVSLHTGTAYTLQFGDAETVVAMTSASANVVTIPANTTELFPIGARIAIQQQGAGSTSIAGGSGVTGTAVGAIIGSQSGVIQIFQSANNVWDLITSGSSSVAKDTIFVNVKDHGVPGRIANDSAPALQALIDLYASQRVVFIFPVDNYRLDSAITCPYDTQTWLCWGAVFLVNHNGVGITFGESGVSHNRPVMLGGRIRHAVSGVAAIDWTAGSVGLRFLNCNYPVGRDISVIGFETGFELRGNGSRGTQYGKFELPDVLSCKFGIACIATGAGSWVNENTIWVGSTSYTSTDPNAAGGYCSYFDAINGASPIEVNNNKITTSFENPTVVLGNPSGAIYNNGSYNSFRDCRYEGFVSPFIIEGPNASQNLYDFGRGLTNSSVATLTSGSQAQVRGLLSQQAKLNPTVVLTASGSYTVPNDVTTVEIEADGAGSGGGGGGTGSATNVGGAGGGPGAVAKDTFTVTPGTVLTVTIGAGGGGGAGGAAGSNPGINGSAGADTTVTGTGVSLTAQGSNLGGRGGGATSTTLVAGGVYGQSFTTSTSGNAPVGQGGQSTTKGSSGVGMSGGGGGGGASASGGFGGNGGAAGGRSNGGAAGSGNTGVVNAGNGADAAANTGAGGGGGGGSQTGTGGTGGAGAKGKVVIRPVG